MKGHISIGKVTVCGTGEQYMKITVEDELSGIEFLSADMSLEDFAKALTGQGFMPTEYELRGLENIGKECQHKTVLMPHSFDASDEDIDEAIGKHEVDGWIGHREDYKNHHNWKDGKVQIRYNRWIEKES